MRKALVVGIIVLFLSISISSSVASENTSSKLLVENNPMDNIEITCRGPLWFIVILRGSVFTIKVTNRNDEAYTYRGTFSVRRPNGDIILGPVVHSLPFKLEPNIPNNFDVWSFRDFREAGCLLGFFYITFKLEVWPDDGSYHTITKEFPGFIFVISAIILNQQGKIVE